MASAIGKTDCHSEFVGELLKTKVSPVFLPEKLALFIKSEWTAGLCALTSHELLTSGGGK